MGVGLMPVREAITRLGGERALEVRRNGRVGIPELTRRRFEELMQARLQLEPLCARRALPYVTSETIAAMEASDSRMNQSYGAKDADALTCGKTTNFTSSCTELEDLKSWSLCWKASGCSLVHSCAAFMR